MRRASSWVGGCTMGRPKKVRAPLPPIWRTPDALWGEVEPILAELDPPKRGPKRIDPRAALDAMIFRVRSGCQWNRLPQEYPDDSSVHRTMQRWIDLGVFERISVAVTGSGRRPTVPCGSRVWGGPRGPQPH